MKQKRILTVQDISCFGKCSGTVALPILSAADIETVVLPTALLSTHTGGFQNYTFLDLTDEMRRITAHWISLGLQFDMLYTGYFGSVEQLTDTAEAADALLADGSLRLIDPVLGDRGVLYSIYDDTFVAAMRKFCAGADLITPNITEACLLTGVPYRGESYDADYFSRLSGGLRALGCASAVITGVRFGESDIGVLYENFRESERFTLSAPRIEAPLHGTGDVFASALAAYMLSGFPLRDALSRTIAFISAAIRDTAEMLGESWYGLHFEGRLGMIADDTAKHRAMASAASFLNGEGDI